MTNPKDNTPLVVGTFETVLVVDQCSFVKLRKIKPQYSILYQIQPIFYIDHVFSLQLNTVFKKNSSFRSTFCKKYSVYYPFLQQS